MSVLILNTTGNRNGFEDNFCRQLKSLISIDERVELKEVRGEAWQSLRLPDSEPYRVVVIVAHGWSDESKRETSLDLGLPSTPLYDLNSPTILTQLLPRMTSDFILLYCACKGLSAETLVSGVDDERCVGVIASRTEIGEDHVSTIAELITYLHESLSSGRTDYKTLDCIVRKVSSREANFDLCYSESPRVYEEDDE